MKRILFVAILALLCTVEANAQSNWYEPSGHYAEKLCTLCDKRIYKYQKPSYSHGGSVIFPHEIHIIPQGPLGATLDAESDITVCEDCRRDHSAAYSQWIKLHRDKFIEMTRTVQCTRIEQNHHDNAVYKEKQDEIDRLRKKIEELEFERQWGADRR